MNTLDNLVKVKELQDDIFVDDLLQKYDDSNPIMIGIVVGGNEQLLNRLRTCVDYDEPIIITSYRGNKVPYFGVFNVKAEHIIDVMSKSEYENKFKKGKVY